MSTSCPFCSRTRIARTGRTELLIYYRCDYCFKQWGEAQVGQRPDERVLGREFPLNAEAADERD